MIDWHDDTFKRQQSQRLAHSQPLEPMAYAGVLLTANLGKTLGALALGALLIGLFWVGMVIA